MCLPAWVPAADKPFTLVLLYGTTVSRHASLLTEIPPVISKSWKEEFLDGAKRHNELKLALRV